MSAGLSDFFSKRMVPYCGVLTRRTMTQDGGCGRLQMGSLVHIESGCSDVCSPFIPGETSLCKGCQGSSPFSYRFPVTAEFGMDGFGVEIGDYASRHS